MSERVNAEGRAEQIWRVVRERTGQPMSITELALECGRMATQRFHTDLAHARHLALDNGEVISPCVWSPQRKEFVLYHLMPGQEFGRMSAPIITKIRDAGTRVHNLSRYSQWQAANGEDAMDRKLATLANSISTSYVQQVGALADLIGEVSKRRGIGR